MMMMGKKHCCVACCLFALNKMLGEETLVLLHAIGDCISTLALSRSDRIPSLYIYSIEKKIQESKNHKAL